MKFGTEKEETKMATQNMNHYPVVRRGQIPRSCSNQTGTASPFAFITCPDCRARFETKVAAHMEVAASYKPGSQMHSFFTADAKRNQAILDGIDFT